MIEDLKDFWEYSTKYIDMTTLNPTVGCLTLKKKKNIDKVIFENNYCIIVDTNGDRYIARPEKGEKFDKEKGLLVALAKYCGFTTTKIHNLLEGAIEKNAKTKKPAKKN